MTRTIALGLVLCLCGASQGAVASNLFAQPPATDERGPDGSTPLQWAVYREDATAVKRLLKAGAKVSEANDYGATAMQLAATVANTEILEALLDAKADVDSPNAEGQTALMAVARTGNV